MTVHIDIQHASEEEAPVPDATLSQWAKMALTHQLNRGEITLRLVSLNEIQHLNRQYRHQDKPTNVLSFPSNLPKEIELDVPLLGDVIICPAILRQESELLNKPLEAHWAHIVIHGVLHLLGYDHIHEEDADIMQPIETQLLAKLGYDDPYHHEDIESD
ncbi:rRNA maturation RNase YbeY [Legionella impletisoli]|uniref:Endoribonuclease YbeY n=1 Tax=Legionella impletisoli TaxID=343510 RepID=A0A917JNP0_9GAMM|nr:rRNA maturation RNase YbeY [Legionella impletisoli]GGI75327.1 endoribonuclease YbeY [Legionella impletisoli]